MVHCLFDVDARRFKPHALHSSERCWPETNCYVDLWIEVLHVLGFDPRAALGFTVAQDFEGDQFTFFKFPLDDLRTLFAVSVNELAIYDRLEQHIVRQVERGRLVLVEMDSFYLPDTGGTAYRREHVKTTVAVARIDVSQRRMGYFHNAGYYELTGDDFDGAFRRLPSFQDCPDVLFPYVEFVKIEDGAPGPVARFEAAVRLLQTHLGRRPANPVTRFRAEFPCHLERLATGSMDYFHRYSFNVLRQLGANFELLGDHCAWLTEHGALGLDASASACQQLAASAKTLQFLLARAVNKRKFGDYSSVLDTMERAHDVAVCELLKRVS